MSLNIKNPETYKLTRRLAALTGESLTEAVTASVRERLERLSTAQDEQDLVERLLAIGRDCAAHMGQEFKSTDHGDLLYDELGLPA